MKLMKIICVESGCYVLCGFGVGLFCVVVGIFVVVVVVFDVVLLGGWGVLV